MLLTPEQQAQYYSLAKKEVLAKLRKEGKNLKTELERLRNEVEGGGVSVNITTDDPPEETE